MLDTSLGYSRRKAIALTAIVLAVQIGSGFVLGVLMGILIGVFTAMHVALPAWASPAHPFLTIAINSVTFLFGLWYGLKQMKARWRELLVPGSGSPVIYAIMLFAFSGIVILYSEINNLIGWLLPPPNFISGLFGSMLDLGAHPISGPFALIILAPLTEELFFRGLILRRLLATRTRAQAIWTSSLLFMAFHVNPWQFPVALILGLVLGWLYLRTRSLGLCMAGHAFFNGCSVLVAGLPFQIRGFNVDHPQAVLVLQPWWFDLLGVAVLASGLFLLARATRPASVPPVLGPGAVAPDSVCESA